MQITAGFLVPYLIAALSFAILRRCSVLPWLIAGCACSFIVLSAWLIPADLPLVRFFASISSAILAIKVIDASIDLRHGRAPTWSEYIGFLLNPFTHVRRTLAQESKPQRRQSIVTALSAFAACGVSASALLALFAVDWSGVPFLVEHVSKVVALMTAIVCALTSGAAIWRLGGGTARDFMDRPLLARTPADFWRRYNRNVHQFFSQDVFSGRRSRRAPVRTILMVFALSALLHELIFLAPIGQVQGYQTAFFALQGIATASIARIKVRGWRVAPWTAGTFAFNMLSSVFFFASIHQVVPFYARGLPLWLR